MQTLQNYQQKLQDFRKTGLDGGRLSGGSSQIPTASSPGTEGNPMYVSYYTDNEFIIP